MAADHGDSMRAPAPPQDGGDRATRRVFVGIDTGGTFTDCVLIGDGAPPIVAKMPSTPDDPSEAIIAGLEHLCGEAGIEFADLAMIAHGTTVATNAMLEERFGRAGLLATAGFRDVIEIGTQVRPALYGLQQRRRPPLVPRERRFDIAGRLTPAGEELVPLSPEDVRDALERLLAQDVEAIAISFLFSYASAAHEQRARELINELAPELYVCCSSDVSPELREYPRTSTTVINAALAPIVRRYLRRLRARLGEQAAERALHIMQSNGGLIAAPQAEESAHTLILSGPSGGLVAAAAVGRSAGRGNLLTLDMGGTSCDVGVIVDGRPRLQFGATVAGVYPLQIPTLDLHTIGAGGGSIAWRDAGGALKVGPRSAGARPGPACYGLGGVDATVTDANLYLGRLNPANFLGGDYPLDPEQAERALAGLAAQTGLDPVRLAHGVIEIANTNMVGALRVVSVQRGLDPREFALVSFGGAGSLHACAIAREMGIELVIVPPRPGLLSALGIALSEIQHDYVKTVVGGIHAAEIGALQAAFTELERRARERFSGRDAASARIVRSLDLRYEGQEYYLNVQVGAHLDRGELDRAAGAFHAAHASSYGHAAPEEPVEIVNLRLLIAESPGPVASLSAPLPASGARIARATREVYFGGHGWLESAIHERAMITVDDTILGPAIVEQMDTTTLIEPTQSARLDEHGNLLVTVGGTR